jgi:hypothetical protein
MTATEACALVVDLTRLLAAASGERDAWRLVAIGAIHRLHDQHVELARLRERHERLIDEYQEYRAATISGPGRAA